MLKTLVEKFRQFLTEKNIRIKGLNYTDRSIGIRVPDAPTGILLQESGILQLYAARAKFVMTTKGLIDMSGSQINLTGPVSIETPHISEFQINQKYFNPEIFNGVPVGVIFDLDNKFVLNESTQIRDNQIVNTTPLNQVIGKMELFLDTQDIDTSELERIEILGKAVGVELPKWIV